MYDATLVHAPTPFIQTSNSKTVRKIASETIKITAAIAAGSFVGLASAVTSFSYAGITAFTVQAIVTGTNLIIFGPTKAVESTAFKIFGMSLMTSVCTLAPLVAGTFAAVKAGLSVYKKL